MNFDLNFGLCLGYITAFVAGLPTIFHIFAHSVPIEERSRAFGYLVAAGSVGQTVASLVRIHFVNMIMF